MTGDAGASYILELFEPPIRLAGMLKDVCSSLGIYKCRHGEPTPKWVPFKNGLDTLQAGAAPIVWVPEFKDKTHLGSNYGFIGRLQVSVGTTPANLHLGEGVNMISAKQSPNHADPG